MRIVIVAQGLPSLMDTARGAFVACRANAYAQAGHQVLAVVPSSSDSSRLLAGPYKVEQVNSVNELTQVVNAFGADAMACHSPDPTALPGKAACALADKVRTVVWIHGYEALYTGLHGYQPLPKVLPSLVRDYLRLGRLSKVLTKVDAVVYVSEWLRRIAERNTGVVAPDTHVIPNPVDTGLFRPGIRGSRGGIRVVLVKGLRRQYGIDVAIRAFSGMKAASLTVIGDGPLLCHYKRLARKWGSPVVFLPAVVPHDDMAKLYPMFDLYLAPSRTEAQGIAMCEAMSCGLPVVASRVGAIPEFVLDGESGILVQPNNSSALRAAVEQFVHFPERLPIMGTKAREFVAKKCDQGTVIQRELMVLGGKTSGSK